MAGVKRKMNLDEQEKFVRHLLDNFQNLKENVKQNLVLFCVMGINMSQNMEDKG